VTVVSKDPGMPGENVRIDGLAEIVKSGPVTVTVRPAL
jgi:hypothetical protein